ncbi:methylated-DNA--[protein]-cysteine S-methyltransferase [Microbacterium sp. P02]|uniref:methylated-DNA--[protein]-cysteine S-methyltransferase n=1 Tax=unclassified Microbacterium TaxID=2609290 RepID=UPI0036733258
MSDLRYRILPSPIGPILVVAAGLEDDLHAAGRPRQSRDTIALLHPFDGPAAYAVERAARVLAGPIEPDESVASHAAEQLEEYFAGRRDTFDLALDWRGVRGFTRAALEAVCEIPYGETASYGEVAVMAGTPRAARAVGTACSVTPFSIVVPVHRVIRSDGSIGEYGGHPEVKRFLLDLEKQDADEVADV